MQSKIETITEGILDKMAILGSIGYTLAVIVMMFGFFSSFTFHMFNRSFYVTVLIVMVISLILFAVGIIGLSVIGRIGYFNFKGQAPAVLKKPKHKTNK